MARHWLIHRTRMPIPQANVEKQKPETDRARVTETDKPIPHGPRSGRCVLTSCDWISDTNEFYSENEKKTSTKMNVRCCSHDRQYSRDRETRRKPRAKHSKRIFGTIVVGMGLEPGNSREWHTN